MAFGFDDAIAAIAETSATEGGGAAAGSAGAGAGLTAAEMAATASALAAKAAPIIGSMALSYALASIFSPRNSIARPDVQTFLSNGYSNTDPINVIYGTRRVGGSRARVKVNSSGGDTNDALLEIVLWGEGPVSRLGTHYFDGTPASDLNGLATGFFSGYINMTTHLGADDQVADPKLVADVADPNIWNEFCTLGGIAYTRFTLGWRPEAFPTGEPTITCEVDGRLCYDPRDGVTRFTSNPALCIRDYLTHARYGKAIPESMIDDDAFADAADYCDETVSVPNFRLATLAVAAAGADYAVGDLVTLAGGVYTSPAQITVSTINGSGGITGFTISAPGSYSTTNPTFTQGAATQHQTGTDGDGNAVYGAGSGATFASATFTQDSEVRYACNGVVNVDQPPLDNLRALLSACRGFLVYSGGQYKLKIDKPETPVAFVLDEDNIVGGWSIQLGGKQSRFNQVRARFFNEAKEFIPDFAIWPLAESAQSIAWLAEDNGRALEPQPLELPFTKSLYMATRICQTEAKRSRFAMLVQLTANIEAMCLEVGDVVPVSHETPGWPSGTDPAEGKLFRVMNIEILYNDEVRLTLHEYSDEVYELDELTLVDQGSATSLPDATTAAAPGTPSALEVLYQTTGSKGVGSRLDVSWMAAADVWVAQGGYYELEYKLAADSTWTRISPISQSAFSIEDLAAGRYDLRVRSVNVVGVHSDYSDTLTIDVFGLTAPPSDVTGFAVQSYAGQAKFTWNKPTANNDLDVLIGGRAFVRWSPLAVGATWQDGSLVNPDGYPGDTTIGFGPLMTGTYLIKFRDSNGNYSTNAASFIVTESLLTGLSTIATVTEHSTFAGLKTKTVAVDGFLRLDTTLFWDSFVGNMDSWGNVDSMSGLSLTGSYHFFNKMDLGSVKTVRLASTIRSQAFDTGDNWDDRTTNIDDWIGPVDGAVIEDAEAELFVRTTNDDPDPPLYMSMSGTAGSGATAPDSALFPTGDIVIIAKIAATDYTPAAVNTIFCKAPGAGTVNAVFLRLLTTGVLRLTTSPDGTASVPADSSVGLNTVVADGADVWIKVIRDVSVLGFNATYFYWSADGITWNDLGVNPQLNAGPTSIVNSTGLSQWGGSGNALASSNFDGKIHYGEIYEGIGFGPIIQRFDPTTDADPGAASFVSHTGETYTIVTNAVITGVGAPTWSAYHALGHVADYTARGFDFRLDFTTLDPTHNRQVDQLSVAARQ